jgi:hypothetical protein
MQLNDLFVKEPFNRPLAETADWTRDKPTKKSVRFFAFPCRQFSKFIKGE